VALLVVLLVPLALWGADRAGVLTPSVAVLAATATGLAAAPLARLLPDGWTVGDFELDWSLPRLYAAFFGALGVLWLAVVASHLLLFPEADVPLTWPVGVFRPRAPAGLADALVDVLATVGVVGAGAELAFVRPIRPLGVVAAGAGAAVLLGFLGRVERRGLGSIFGLGVVLVFLTNLSQGRHRGLVRPLLGLRGHEEQYYEAVPRVDSGADFLAAFNRIQSTLPLHAETHPPGAVLLYYYPHELVANPVFVGSVLAVLALLSVFYVHALVRRLYDGETASFVSLAFVLLPAVQIYSYSSLDAVVALAFAGALYHYVRFVDDGAPLHALVAAGFVTLSMLLTFLGAFFLGVVGLDQLRRNGVSVRAVRDGAAVYVPIALALGLLLVATGFDWLAAFEHARAAESEAVGGSLYALADPVSYVYTRVESLLEPLVFFTPLLGALAYRGLRDPVRSRRPAGDWGTDRESPRRVRDGGAETRRSARPDDPTSRLDEGGWFAAYALFGFGLMLLTGAPHTGETARSGMFLLPFLLLPVASHVSKLRVGPPELRTMALLVGGQSLLMQLFGFYMW
jgi:hypothetical protein